MPLIKLTEQQVAKMKARLEDTMRRRGTWRDDITPLWRITHDEVACYFRGDVVNSYEEWCFMHDKCVYEMAWRENAWLMRAEGLSYRAIAAHCGNKSAERARQMILWFGRRAKFATRHMKFYYITLAEKDESK